MKEFPVYAELANLIAAIENCRQSRNGEWLANHTARAQWIVQQFMPSGSGIDCGTKLDFERSKRNKLVFHTSFHHINENGMYDGWTNHTVTVKPDLLFGFTLGISGSNRNDVKDYLAEEFDYALNKICKKLTDGGPQYGWQNGDEWVIAKS